MKKSALLAIIIALAAGLWILSGTFGERFGLAASGEPQKPVASIAERNAEAPASERLTAVRTLTSIAGERTREIVARGRTEAKRKVTLKSELKGRIEAIGVKKGARVKQGQVIARIAMNDREAHLAEAKALVRQRQIEYDAAQTLRKKGYRAETQYAGAAAQLDAAKAMVKQMEVEIARTSITAPFDALVDDRMVEIGDYVDGGTPIALLVDENPFLLVAQVSEQDVTRLRVGADAFAMLVDGQTVRGKVNYIATTAQPETRTFRVEVEVDNSKRTLRDGVTADIHFPTESIQAHYLSAAALTLSDHGVIGVRSVDGDSKVAFHPVKIVGSDADGVWLAGLPPQIDIIVVGQEFVRDGDKVRRGGGANGSPPTS